MTAISVLTATSESEVAALPVRSPRTSIVLAALARQHRWERRQRRAARARRHAWLARFDPKPFESIRQRPSPGLVVSGNAAFVYALQPSC